MENIEKITELVIAVNGKAVTTSLKIAEVFGKRHADVIRAVESLQVPNEWHERNFALMSVDVRVGNGATRTDKAFTVTRDGMALLCFGFTGARAMKFKLAYIDAFNKMEAALLRGDTSLHEAAKNGQLLSSHPVFDQVAAKLRSGEASEHPVFDAVAESAGARIRFGTLPALTCNGMKIRSISRKTGRYFREQDLIRAFGLGVQTFLGYSKPKRLYARLRTRRTGALQRQVLIREDAVAEVLASRPRCAEFLRMIAPNAAPKPVEVKAAAPKQVAAPKPVEVKVAAPKPEINFTPCESSSEFSLGLASLLRARGLTLKGFLDNSPLDGYEISRCVEGRADWALPLMDTVAKLLGASTMRVIAAGHAQVKEANEAAEAKEAKEAKRKQREAALARIKAEKAAAEAKLNALREEEDRLNENN